MSLEEFQKHLTAQSAFGPELAGLLAKDFMLYVEYRSLMALADFKLQDEVDSSRRALIAAGVSTDDLADFHLTLGTLSRKEKFLLISFLRSQSLQPSA